MAEEIQQYAITVRKQIPYISEFFLGTLSVCLITLAIIFFFFGAPLLSSNEMKVVAAANYISPNVIWITFWSGVGFLLFRYLYKHIIIKQPAILTFSPTSIIIKTKKFIYQIPILNIEDIKLIDPTDLDDFPKGEFFVIIYQVKSKSYQFQLNDYSDSDSFIDNLLKYDTLKNHIKNPERLKAPDIITEDN